MTRATGSRPAAPSRRGATAGNGAGLVRTTLTEQTYEALKERILDRRLEAGARLSIDAISRELNVSSSPIREALVRLEAERLVTSELYAGYSVAPHPTNEYLRDLLAFRITLEGQCALLGAPRQDRAVLAAMRQAYEQMARAPRIGRRYREYYRFVQADGRFHQALVDSAGNAVMTEVYATLQPIILQSRLYFSTQSDDTRLEEVLGEHRQVLEAFEAGDGEAARAALVAHLDGGRRRLLDTPG